MVKNTTRSKTKEPVAPTCFGPYHPTKYSLRPIPQRLLSNSHHNGNASGMTPSKRRKDIVCFCCRDIGHYANRCPQKKQDKGAKCFKCGDLGHYARDCPQQRLSKREEDIVAISLGLDKGKGVSSKCVIQESTGPNEVLLSGPEELPATTCAECGKTGHDAQSCPPLRQATCFACGQPGHYSYNCPALYCPYCKKHHLPEGCLKNLVACTRCGEKGHEKSQCTTNCPNCEEDHPPGECPTRKITCFLCEGQDHCPKDCSMNLLLTKAAEIQRLSLQAAIRLVVARADKSK